MAAAELRLALNVDSARDAIAVALAEQGFAVQQTPSGSLDVSRGVPVATPVADSATGADADLQFHVHVTEIPEGALASFERSTTGGSPSGGASGTADGGDLVREAASLAGEQLASRGLLLGAAGLLPSPAASGAGDAPSLPSDGVTAASAPTWPAPHASAEPEPPGAPIPPYVGVTPAVPSGYPGASPAAPSGYPGAPDDAGSPYAPGAAPTAPATPPYAPGATPSALGTAPSAPGAAPAASGRTNGVAIAAIIMGFVLPLGGIIAGAIALSQIKRTGEKGRGLAIGGIVAGGVIGVLSIVATVGLVLFALLGAGVAATSTQPFDAPDEPSGGSVTVGPGEQLPSDAYTLPVGACLDDIPSGIITPSNIVDCAQPHAYEVFGSFFLADGEFPGDDAIESSAYEGCDAVYLDYVGVAWDQSALSSSYVAPTEETWAEGDREVSCLLYDPEADLTTGSLRGSAR